LVGLVHSISPTLASSANVPGLLVVDKVAAEGLAEADGLCEAL